MACVCCALTCIHLTTVPLSAISEGMCLSVCSIYIRQLLGAQQKCMHYHAANISYIQISISHTSNISYVQISYIQEHAYVCSIYPTSWNVWIVVYCKHNNSKSLDTPIGGGEIGHLCSLWSHFRYTRGSINLPVLQISGAIPSQLEVASEEACGYIVVLNSQLFFITIPPTLYVCWHSIVQGFVSSVIHTPLVGLWESTSARKSKYLSHCANCWLGGWYEKVWIVT